MQLTTALPLLVALGARVLVNALLVPSDPTAPPSTPDLLLIGLFQGVLLQTTLAQSPQLALAVAAGAAAKLVTDFLRTPDVVRAACTLLGAALGVLAAELLAQFVDPIVAAQLEGTSRSAVPVLGGHSRETKVTSKRIRLVSFGRDRNRSRKPHNTAHRDREEHDRHRDRDPHHERDRDLHRDRERDRTERHGRSTDVRAITPTLTYCSTAPSISLDSMPSSLDPEGLLTPAERDVAMLRARASLADSERRRFKEERKWALSTGNTARADQLAWQVRRYTALMESFHREADAKVVEAARAAAPSAPDVSSTRRRSHSRQRKPSLTHSASHSAPAHNDSPLVSVTVGAGPRTRKLSGTSAATLKPAIFVHGRE
ncbi:hypothetical protein C2E23DRAFT_16853 [Lenzites betulinus]|nr:hypothetical protein C2E23DRAFT_16853 [Lenzites betulinus]